MRSRPQLDPATVGISLVDILFGLAVGQVFMPIAQWAQTPIMNPLPTTSWLHLGAALAITITSWIGYHSSANRARFRIQFFNVEFVKLVFDLLMVALYFVLAAYALREHATARTELLLVLGAFVLYAGWDLASAYQKRQSPSNKYRQVWDEVRADPTRTDVTVDWEPTDWGRVRATLTALAVVGGLTAFVSLAVKRPTRLGSILIDVVLIAILLAYRLVKEWWTKAPVLEPRHTWSVIFRRTADGWTAEVPTLPGITVDAPTREEAEHHVGAAITAYVQTLDLTGRPVPAPDDADVVQVTAPSPG